MLVCLSMKLYTIRVITKLPNSEQSYKVMDIYTTTCIHKQP
jgi:hypothetical protein